MIAAPSLPTAAPPPAWFPRSIRWTVETYDKVREQLHAVCHLKTMLIDGELIAVPPADENHDAGLGLADYLLKALFGEGFFVRVQLSLITNFDTDPQPDVCVVRGSPRASSRDVADALIVVEVANSSRGYDLGDKASLYAAAGVADYWVTDLIHDRVVVHRQPKPDLSAKYGHRYAAVTALARGQSLAPLALPNRPVAAEELLP